MYKRKPIKITALLLTLCLLVTAFSGTAIQVQAEELTANVSAIASSTAYPFYFRHFYDEASFTAAKRQYINSAVSFANQTIKAAMLSEGLSVTIGSSANYIQADTITPMHDCPLPMDEPCSNPLGCGSFALHHKDTKRISQYMYNARTEAAHHFRAIWCDRPLGTFCEYDNNVHQYYTVYAVVYDYRPVLQIMTLDTSTRTEAYMSLLLTHETVHCLKFTDVYGAGVHTDDDVYACIMDYFDLPVYDDAEFAQLYSDWTQNRLNAFCADCREGIAVAIEDSFPGI